MMFKRSKCSREDEINTHSLNLKLESLVEEYKNLLETIDKLIQDFLRNEIDMARYYTIHNISFLEYERFIKYNEQPSPPSLNSLPDFSPFKMALKTTKIPQKRYDEFVKERNTRTEIVNEHCSRSKKQVIKVDMIHMALDEVINKADSVKLEIHRLSNIN